MINFNKSGNKKWLKIVISVIGILLVAAMLVTTIIAALNGAV